MARLIRLSGLFSFAVAALVGSAWSAMALHLHLEGPARSAALAALAAALIAAFVARRAARRAGWAVVGLAAIAVTGWYSTIEAQEDRDWALDVSRGVKARVEGDIVTLADLRDFDWKTREEAEPRWISKRYDLTQLETLDMITSVWDSPDIAHLLVSFGFSDGEHVVFSVEIRREADETFNELDGFFCQFEMVLIGATERDIVKLRTNHREERVSLFSVDLTPEQRRTMFMSYVELAQQLEKNPKFYNTITANCTTTVYRLARTIKSDMPLDTPLVLSGRLPEYLDGLGVLGGEGSLDERRAAALITPIAQALPNGADLSAAIRAR